MNTVPAAAPAAKLAGGFRGLPADWQCAGLPGAPSRGAAGPPPLLCDCRLGELDVTAGTGHGDCAWSASGAAGLPAPGCGGPLGDSAGSLPAELSGAAPLGGRRPAAVTSPGDVSAMAVSAPSMSAAISAPPRQGLSASAAASVAAAAEPAPVSGSASREAATAFGAESSLVCRGNEPLANTACRSEARDGALRWDAGTRFDGVAVGGAALSLRAPAICWPGAGCAGCSAAAGSDGPASRG